MRNVFLSWVSLCVAILLFLSCEGKKNIQDVSLLQRQTKQLENLKTLSKLQHLGEGKRLEDIYVYDMQGDSVRFSQLFAETDKIVFFFSEYGCSSCYIPFLKKITAMQNELKDKLVVIAGFESKRDFKIYMEDKDIPFEKYRVKTNFNIFPEYNDYSLAFLTNKNRVVDNLMIIDQSNKAYIDDYLQIVNIKCGRPLE